MIMNTNKLSNNHLIAELRARYRDILVSHIYEKIITKFWVDRKKNKKPFKLVHQYHPHKAGKDEKNSKN